MRVSLIHPDRQVLNAWLKALNDAGHVVESSSLYPKNAIEMEVRDEPDLMVVSDRCAVIATTFSGRILPAPDKFVRSPDDVTTLLEIVESAREKCRDFAFRPRANARVIFWSDDWPRSPTKLRLPDYDNEGHWRERIQQQEGFLCLLLNRARVTLPAASAWLKIFEQYFEETKREHAYRIVHQSWKGYAWSRDAKLRLCGFFCHFLPGFDLEDVPHPMLSRPDAEYVHCQPSFYLVYPMGSLLNYAFVNPSVKDLLASSLDKEPREFSSSQLATESAIELGAAESLFHIARAHLVALEALTCSAHDFEPYMRELGTLFEFWDMEFFNRMPAHKVRSIADNILSGKTYVEGPPRALPNYREFIECSKTTTPL